MPESYIPVWMSLGEAETALRHDDLPDFLCEMIGDALEDELPRSLEEMDREHPQPDVSPCVGCQRPIDAGIGTFWLAEDELWTRVTGTLPGANPIIYCPACFTALAADKGLCVWWEPHLDA